MSTLPFALFPRASKLILIITQFVLPFTNDETEASRGNVTFPRSHSSDIVEPEFEPRQSDAKVYAPNYYYYTIK